MELKYNQILLSIIAALFIFAGSVNASTKGDIKGFFTHNMDYEINAHFSLGGTAPLSMPKEIRKIESYNPALQLGLGAHATKWLCDDKTWAVRLGAGVQGKGMKTEARVKNYFTEVIQDKSSVRGYFTGLVETDIKNTYVVVPLSLVHSISNRVNLYGGLHASFLIDKGFSGFVSDGYLRQGTPIGTKITFEGENSAAYDFSDEVQNIQWGMQLGADWALKKHLNLFANLEYDFNDVFKKDFSAITFTMHNIYLNIGFGYKF